LKKKVVNPVPSVSKNVEEYKDLMTQGKKIRNEEK